MYSFIAWLLLDVWTMHRSTIASSSVIVKDSIESNIHSTKYNENNNKNDSIVS